VLESIVVGPEDWRLWRSMRLAALEEAPSAFGSTLGEWSGERDTEASWRARLSEVALNIVVLRNGEPAGMVSAVAPGETGDVELISLWVTPGARGAGVGAEAIRAVCHWTDRTYPGTAIVLSVRSHNARARARYERHGFVDAGPSPHDPSERLMRRAPTG
jgi:RimJ/RimL family protein N-acetyltransferase